jgi:segregation and condensation protein B
MTEIEIERTSEGLNLPYFFTLERVDQQRALESLIFASEEPLSIRVLTKILVHEDPTQEVPGQQELPLNGEEPSIEEHHVPFEVPKGYFDALIDEINDDLERTDRPFRIVKVAGGWQFATTPQHGQLVQRLLKARNRRRLTQAALETLAIVAYRQPITKPEIDAIRGVNAGEVVNSLVEKGLIAMVGRSEHVGKPLLYGTTDEFLRIFGLHSLSDLPKLREIDDLLKTTTTMVEMEESMDYSTDHRTLRRQLAMLLEDDRDVENIDDEAAELETSYEDMASGGEEEKSDPEPEEEV